MKFTRSCLMTAILCCSSVCSIQAKNVDHISQAFLGFQSTPDSTRTKVWWFHGETETTQYGITADLEAFKKAGVGGVVYYDQTFGKMENAFPGFFPNGGMR